MMRRTVCLFPIIMAFLGVFAMSMAAQTVTSTITGSVLDSTLLSEATPWTAMRCLVPLQHTGKMP
ncbi:MAG: hypothetical protein KIT83_01775 [Bryobacterales bacterium]|nr:hypothetical protein [Bryobacterales bacterium]